MLSFMDNSLIHSVPSFNESCPIKNIQAAFLSKEKISRVYNIRYKFKISFIFTLILRNM